MKASLASGTIYFAGDVTAQTLIESKSDIDFERTARFALIGACWAGPFCRAGMSRISQFSTKWYYRVALDQSLLMPLNMAVVNWLKPIADGKDTETAVKIWQEKYPQVMALAWVYWVPSALLLYGFTRCEQVRFLLFNMAAYIWQVNLARIMNHSNSTTGQQTKQKSTKRSRYIRRVSLTTLIIWFSAHSQHHAITPWSPEIFFNLFSYFYFIFFLFTTKSTYH